MVSRGFKAMVGEANAAIETISVDDAKALHGGDAVFVDVREAGEWDKGRVAGALHASRGLLEFIADPEGPYHNPAFAAGKKLVLYCASGGRSALAAKTLVDMGIGNVCHVAGGFRAWSEAGGAVEG